LASSPLFRIQDPKAGQSQPRDKNLCLIQNSQFSQGKRTLNLSLTTLSRLSSGIAYSHISLVVSIQKSQD